MMISTHAFPKIKYPWSMPGFCWRFWSLHTVDGSEIPHTVDGSEIPNHHLGCMKPCKSWDKLPYQLVQDFFHQQYLFRFSPLAAWFFRKLFAKMPREMSLNARWNCLDESTDSCRAKDRWTDVFYSQRSSIKGNSIAVHMPQKVCKQHGMYYSYW